jgi:hypothetical protein
MEGSSFEYVTGRTNKGVGILIIDKLFFGEDIFS